MKSYNIKQDYQLPKGTSHEIDNTLLTFRLKDFGKFVLEDLINNSVSLTIEDKQKAFDKINTGIVEVVFLKSIYLILVDELLYWANENNNKAFSETVKSRSEQIDFANQMENVLIESKIKL